MSKYQRYRQCVLFVSLMFYVPFVEKFLYLKLTVSDFKSSFVSLNGRGSENLREC